MTTTAETGQAGERAATEHLRREGYDIRALNWRQGRYELDIVALKEGVLHFVEVKTRRAGSLTPPEAAATQRKFRALSRAAECYLRTTGWDFSRSGEGLASFFAAGYTCALKICYPGHPA